MTLTHRQAELLRAIAGLPDDDWQPMDWAVLSVAQQRAREEVAALDRADARRAADEAARVARGKPAKSKRGPRQPHALQKARKVVYERSGGDCEARSQVCVGAASHVHHIAGRKGPDAHAPENLLHVCQPCHTYLHANPEESYTAGWMRKRLGVAS